MLNKYQSDYIPIQDFDTVTFKDVDHDAFSYLVDPDPEWKHPDDCVDFPCTAPSNALYKFNNVQFTGSKKPSIAESKFQLIADTDDVASKMETCQFEDPWNAWWCTNENLGVMVATAKDGDQMDRSVAPMYVTNAASGYLNKVNSYMDHVWDGFYTGQKRKSEFPVLV